MLLVIGQDVKEGSIVYSTAHHNSSAHIHMGF